MKIFYHLKSGAARSLHTWKGILVMWVSVLFLISLLALPVKTGLKSMLGSSMVTELLKDSVNVDVISDLKLGLEAILPVFTIGFLLVCLFGLMLNVFFTGGIFALLSNKNNTKSARFFFGESASNFWSYIVISLTASAIYLLAGSVITGIPMLIISLRGSGTNEPGSSGIVLRIMLVIMALLLPVILLVADYARAWQADKTEKRPFKAIGYGFSRTFKTFFQSYIVMLVVLLIQAGYGAMVVSKLMTAKLSTGLGVFLLFLTSQALFIIKIVMRTWRYGCITSLFEDKEEKVLS
jgi:hypothetical protein